MKCDKLLKLEEIIKPILEKSISARNDDFYLYYEVIKVLNAEVEWNTLGTVLKGHKELGLPNYESVTRVRRKLQATYPELESERTRNRRLRECKEYKEYAAM